MEGDIKLNIKQAIALLGILLMFFGLGFASGMFYTSTEMKDELCFVPPPQPIKTMDDFNKLQNLLNNSEVYNENLSNMSR